jgi:glycerol kinase
MKRYVLAIDQGTTGSRAIVYDKRGHQVASAYEEFPQYFPKPGWVEHDPAEIWQSVNNSIQKVLRKVLPMDITAIGITNQRETTVVWNKKSGRPIHRAIVWQCRRTAERCRQLKKREPAIRRRTGLPVDAYFSATKLEWILQHCRANKKELAFGTTDSWVLWKLTGGKSHATDYTNASRTMLFNINRLSWDKELLKLFKIPAAILPKVLPSSSQFGETIKIGLLPAGIPICGIAGDQQAALFGQTCFEPGTSKNTYGTGAFILLNTGKERINSHNGLITTLACGPKGEPVYALEGSIFIAGAAIQWLRDGLKIIASSAESEKLASSIQDNEEVYFVPALVGLGAPYWKPEARGLICGLTRGTRREHLVRAALEAICYSTKDVLLAMEKDSGLKVKELKVDGGAVANNFLCQFQSEVLGRPVIRPRITELTSLGAAYLAGLAVGFWKSSREIKKFWQQDRSFRPVMKRAATERAYQLWQKAIKKTLTS